MYDAIIVGARCAGASTAMLLARREWRVLAVDRADFPSDTLSTHFVTPDGTAKLLEWGLLESVKANGAPEVHRLTMTLGDVIIPNRFNGSPLPGLCPRRGPFDKLLVDAAREAGAEVRERFHVKELLQDGEGRVTGIRGVDASGATVEAAAAIVIGADGKESFVAKAVGAEEYDVRETHTGGFYSYFEGVPYDGGELHIVDRKMFFLFPTDNGQACIGAEWPIADFETFRADVEGNLMKTLELAPDLAARVRQGRRIERFHGFVMPRSYFRRPFGPGWALVGDAGYLKDPVTGLGMADALRDAALLAEAVDAGLAGRERMEEALAAYERRRNEASKLMYEVTAQLATLDPPRPLVELMAAQMNAPAETSSS